MPLRAVLEEVRPAGRTVPQLAPALDPLLRSVPPLSREHDKARISGACMETSGLMMFGMSDGVASTGTLFALASSRASFFGYTNSWP